VPAPVLLIHGFASSFDHNWVEPGWVDLLTEEGRQVIGGDLPGHGSSPKPADPAAYENLEDQVAATYAEHPLVDGVGFSLGARILLTLAARDPSHFGRLVVMGVGANLFRSEGHEAIAKAVESGADPEDVGGRVFAQLASDPRNDRAALAALMRRNAPAVTPDLLRAVTCPVLVVLGDRDFAGPAGPLMEALPHAELVTLPGVDHFATPRDYRCIDAVLGFLGSS